jgi:hypothetical protein
MKKQIVLFSFLLITSITFAQKKDKIKGSKVVTVEQKQIESFSGLEVTDNIQVMLTSGNECSLEIEADDNLHDAVDISLSGSTLRLSTLKDIIGYKKLTVRLTYTADFKLVVAKNEAQVTAINDVENDGIVFRSYDYAKLFLNANTTTFSLECNDKSKVDLNLKAEKATITVSKNATLKALIKSKEMIFDMYQKADATIEGDVVDLKLRLDNNASFIGKNLAVQNIDITTEGSSNASINATKTVSIDASGKSEIQLYGDQKIDMKRFIESAVLMKKLPK